MTRCYISIFIFQLLLFTCCISLGSSLLPTSTFYEATEAAREAALAEMKSMAAYRQMLLEQIRGAQEDIARAEVTFSTAESFVYLLPFLLFCHCSSHFERRKG